MWRRLLLAFVAVLVVAVAASACVLTQPVTRSERVGPEAKPDSALLEKHVRALSEQFHPRDYEHVENLDKVAAYIRDAFAATGAKAVDQPYEVKGRTYRNVRALYGPPGNDRVVIG